MSVDKGMHKTLGDLLGSLRQEWKPHEHSVILSVIIVYGGLIHRSYMQDNMISESSTTTVLRNTHLFGTRIQNKAPANSACPLCGDSSVRPSRRITRKECFRVRQLGGTEALERTGWRGEDSISLEFEGRDPYVWNVKRRLHLHDLHAVCLLLDTPSLGLRGCF